MKRRAITWGNATALLSLLLHPFAAAAAGLGNIDLQSRFGQPLLAEIEILSSPGERIAEACYQLAPGRANDGDIPRINRAQVRVRDAGGNLRLVLSTTNPIREPLMLMSIRIDCGIGMTKEFTLLFSPAEPTAAATADALHRPAPQDASSPTPITAAPARGAIRLAETKTAPETPRTMARALYPEQPRMQRRFADALIEANPGLDLFSDTPIPPTASIVLPNMGRLDERATVVRAPRPAPPTAEQARPPARTAPRAGKRAGTAKATSAPAAGLQFADRLMLSRGEPIEPGATNEPPLRLALSLATLRHGGDDDTGIDEPAERRREALRAEYRALSGSSARGWANTEGDERRQMIRQSAAEFRQLAELLDRLASPVVVPAPAAVPEAAPALSLASTAASAEPATPEAKTPTAEVAGALGVGQTLAALSVATLAVFGWVFFSRRRELAKRYSYNDLPPVVDADSNTIVRPALWPETDWRHAPPPMADAGRDQTPSAPSAAATRSIAAETDPTETVADEPAVDDMNFVVDIDEKAEDVIELADIMLAFGRFRGAANLLEDAIAERPAESLLPWTKLLDIYCENDMRAEFEDLAARLNKTFNVAAQSWDEARHAAIAGEPAPSLSLADFPHIRGQIEALWGTPEGARYLKNLIHDNRDGTRSGFRRHVAEEILFLSDVLDERLKKPS